jgi:hypothetical protein
VSGRRLFGIPAGEITALCFERDGWRPIVRGSLRVHRWRRTFTCAGVGDIRRGGRLRAVVAVTGRDDAHHEAERAARAERDADDERRRAEREADDKRRRAESARRYAEAVELDRMHLEAQIALHSPAPEDDE